MNGAELRARRLLLGLTQDQLGALLRPSAPVSGRDVRRWEADIAVRGIPPWVDDQVRWLADLTAEALDDVVDSAEAGPPIVMAPGSDRVNVLRPGPGGLAWPVSWWRMLTARALDRVPNATVVYEDEANEATASYTTVAFAGHLGAVRPGAHRAKGCDDLIDQRTNRGLAPGRAAQTSPQRARTSATRSVESIRPLTPQGPAAVTLTPGLAKPVAGSDLWRSGH